VHLRLQPFSRLLSPIVTAIPISLVVGHHCVLQYCHRKHLGACISLISSMAGSLEMPSASAVELSDLASPRQHEDANSVRVVLLEDSNSETEVANAKDDASKIHEPAGSLLARKTLLTVVACYVLGNHRLVKAFVRDSLITCTAFLIAVTHYVLFRVLDGKDLSGNPVLSQPRNTAISLILVTAFRASLLTALEVSSAQSLWLLLRSKTLPVSLIESLFWMQRNIFELANPKIVRHAPILLLAAVVYWAVSIAIIYPPGALIVQSEQVSYMTKVNASVMNPRPDLNTQEDIWPVMKSLADIWFADKELFNFPTGTGSSGRFSVRYSFEAPVPRLQRIVNLGIATGQIITLTPLGTANSSHSFSFEGPQVRCRSLPKVTTTKDVRGDAFHHELVFNTSWSGVRRDEVSPATIIFSTNEVKGYFPALNQSAPAVPGSYNRSMTLVIEQSVTECDAYQTNFTVDFRYESGVQMVKYNADTGSKLLFQTRLGLRKYATKDGEYVHNSQEYREWAANLLHWNHVASCYAILDTVGKSLTYNWNLLLITSPSNTNTAGTYRLPNGSDVEINEILIPTYNDEYKDLSKL
jgi:hypothetical protein